MGDYLEEILDSNDLEAELMIALDESEVLNELDSKELFGKLLEDDVYE